MFGKKIKISNELYDKLAQVAKVLKCADIEELGQRILEAEADKILSSVAPSNQEMSADEVKAIENQLKGLGYID